LLSLFPVSAPTGLAIVPVDRRLRLPFPISCISVVCLWNRRVFDRANRVTSVCFILALVKPCTHLTCTPDTSAPACHFSHALAYAYDTFQLPSLGLFSLGDRRLFLRPTHHSCFCLYCPSICRPKLLMQTLRSILMTLSHLPGLDHALHYPHIAWRSWPMPLVSQLQCRLFQRLTCPGHLPHPHRLWNYIALRRLPLCLPHIFRVTLPLHPPDSFFMSSLQCTSLMRPNLTTALT